MKIGIYARGLSMQLGGVKEAIKAIVENLIRIIDDKDQLYIIHNLPEKYFKSDKSNVEEILMSSSNKLVCDFILAPKIINKLDLDVVWFSKGIISYGVKAKKVYIIYDLIYYLPEYDAYKFFDTVYMKFMIKSAIRRSDKILAISKNTKQDIVKIGKVPDDKVIVSYLSADTKVFKIVDDEKKDEVRKKYNLPEKYILFTGGITPRKNIRRLIKAFNNLDQYKDMYLVLTGSSMYKCKEEADLISKNPSVLRIGFVDEEDMPALYNCASIYAYPSLYEGFGLPILEAQACGCPVITSGISSMPEVGADSVLYIDPYNEEDIKNSIEKLTNDDNLRQQLIEKGFENVKRFSWQGAAQIVLDTLKMV